MPYNVPNGSVAASIDLAEPDSGDYQALGFHRTGVVSGGRVQQSGTPSMTVQVDGAEIVIDGLPIAKPASPVTLDPSSSAPRFDLIVWNVTGNAVAIKGTPDGNNPVYPVFDPTTQCLTAAVYIGSSVSTITNAYIVQKQAAPITSLRRNYAADTDVVLEATTPTKPTSFKTLANGTVSWVSSVLSRTADSALEWLTSLTIRQPTSTDKALVLKSAVGAVKGNNVFELQPSGATTALAALDAVGLFLSANFRYGSGSPEGVVTADRPALYLNTAPTGGNDAVYVKTSDGVATGWVALGAYVANSQAVPVGSVLPWPGDPTTPPAGWLVCNGSEQTTAAYANLSAFCGTRFGTAAAGNFKLPDYRGRTLFGIDGTLANVSGVNVGAAEVTLSVEQLPSHDHPLIAETHAHPAMGQYFFYRDLASTPSYAIPANTGTGYGVDLEPPEYSHAASATIFGKTAAVGGDQPISLLQPSQSVAWLIKT